jgi:hypothetical protein
VAPIIYRNDMIVNVSAAVGYGRESDASPPLGSVTVPSSSLRRPEAQEYLGTGVLLSPFLRLPRYTTTLENDSACLFIGKLFSRG